MDGGDSLRRATPDLGITGGKEEEEKEEWEEEEEEEGSHLP